MTISPRITLALGACALFAIAAAPKPSAVEGKKKVVFVAGGPSHGPGAHEHNGGCTLLANLLNEHLGESIEAVVYRNGWPSDPAAFDGADALVMFCDGGARHVAYKHREQVNALAARGVGIGAIHYAVEMTPGDSHKDLISWIGGAFEINYSVNPHWEASFTGFPKHPVARGLKPFATNDEWYFHMRFLEEMKGITPVLSAVPPESTMKRRDGPHSGNPIVRKAVAAKSPQHVCWVTEREDGGRGFGCTGAHFHKNWADDNFRMTVLNAITWIAKAEVPAGGVVTPTPSTEELVALHDENQRKRKPKARKTTTK